MEEITTGVERIQVEGKEASVYLFGGKGSGSFDRSAVNLVLEKTFHRLSSFSGMAGDAAGGKDGSSNQVGYASTDATTSLEAVGKLHVEAPLVDPVAYRETYRRDSTIMACCDVKAAYVGGQGWRMRPRNELFGNDQFASAALLKGEPSREQLDVALRFLNASEPDYSLTELITHTDLDIEVGGNGYIEVARDADGKPVRFYYAPAETMRILNDYTGFVQVRGRKRAFWSRYGTGNRTVVVKKSGEDTGLDGIEAKFVGLAIDQVEAAPLSMTGVSELGEWCAKAEVGDNVATSVNEMMHFRLFTPRDTNYGEPCTISAIEDYLGDSNAKLFMVEYFDRCTVPRLAVVIEGDELSDTVIKNLKEWAESQDKLEAMNSTMVLQIPPGSKAEFERLSSEQLKEGGFLDYREMCAAAIRTAHRVPESIVATAGNSNRAESEEANMKFVTGVVRPRQLMFMSRINYLLREELGVTDWVFDLNVPDLVSEKTKAEIADIYMRRGSWTINDVRKSQGQVPIAGGDNAFVLVPGAGVVFVETFDTLAEAKDTKVAAPQGQKTPPKGTDVTMGKDSTE